MSKGNAYVREKMMKHPRKIIQLSCNGTKRRARISFSERAQNSHKTQWRQNVNFPLLSTGREFSETNFAQ
jgi:hypothetical protein